MPVLQNPRHEAFAQARARGALLEEAYEYAGYVPRMNHASRLGKTPEIIERIAELNLSRFATHDISPKVWTDALLEAARASLALASVGGIEQARLAIVEAQRMSRQFTKRRDEDRTGILIDIDETDDAFRELAERRVRDPSFVYVNPRRAGFDQDTQGREWLEGTPGPAGGVTETEP